MERTIICISRQYGSGGREIGEAVAKKLGFPATINASFKKPRRKRGFPKPPSRNTTKRARILALPSRAIPLRTPPRWARRFTRKKRGSLKPSAARF